MSAYPLGFWRSIHGLDARLHASERPAEGRPAQVQAAWQMERPATDTNQASTEVAYWVGSRDRYAGLDLVAGQPTVDGFLGFADSGRRVWHRRAFRYGLAALGSLVVLRRGLVVASSLYERRPEEPPQLASLPPAPFGDPGFRPDANDISTFHAHMEFGASGQGRLGPGQSADRE